MLTRIVERMAKLPPPRHRELVRGMLAELDSIADPNERTRFALGALTAIARLTLSGERRAAGDASARFIEIGAPEVGSNPGGRSMSKLTARQLLLRHAIPFVVSLVSLTLLLYVQRRVPDLREGGTDGAFVELLLLSLPSALALTIPMAVFLAVAWVFARWAPRAFSQRHGERGAVFVA